MSGEFYEVPRKMLEDLVADLVQMDKDTGIELAVWSSAAELVEWAQSTRPQPLRPGDIV